MSSIIKENQYFDNGCDFCKVYTCDMLDRVERALLEARISFSIREEDTVLSASIRWIMNGRCGLSRISAA